MSEESSIEFTEPKPFPPTALVGLQVPYDLHRVIVAAADKKGIHYDEQILAWVQQGAECERLHGSKEKRSAGRKRK